MLSELERVMEWMFPAPERQRRPRPEREVLPQRLGVRWVLSLGVMVRVEPVQARRARRWRMVQSVVPSRWRMQRVV